MRTGTIVDLDENDERAGEERTVSGQNRIRNQSVVAVAERLCELHPNCPSSSGGGAEYRTYAKAVITVLEKMGWTLPPDATEPISKEQIGTHLRSDGFWYVRPEQ